MCVASGGMELGHADDLVFNVRCVSSVMALLPRAASPGLLTALWPWPWCLLTEERLKEEGRVGDC